MRKKTAASPAAVSSCRKSLFATTRHFSELQKALKNGDHHRAGHPSRVSRTHPSAPLTKGSHSFGWPRNRRISCGGFVVSKKSFRHDETSFRASKALKDGDHHRAGHPSRVSRTHSSAPLTKGSRSFGWPRNRRISCGGFVVSKKSFRHDETSFRASKSSERWGSSSCRTPFPGFPHTLFRPVDERFPLFWLAQKPPHLLRRFRRGEKVFSPR